MGMIEFTYYFLQNLQAKKESQITQQDIASFTTTDFAQEDTILYYSTYNSKCKYKLPNTDLQ